MNNEKMSKAEVIESLDRRLSGLQGDPLLTAKVLAKAEGDKPVRKLSRTAILVIALLVVTMAGALAVSHWGAINRFFAGGYVNEEAIVSAMTVKSDMKMLRFTAADAYWTSYYGLTVAIKAEPADPDCLMYYEEGEHPEQIEYNGESVPIEEFRGDKKLISCEMWAGGEDSFTWYDYTDEGFFIYVNDTHPDPEKLKAGTEMSIQCWCENLQTEEREDGKITIELPPMTMNDRIE